MARWQTPDGVNALLRRRFEQAAGDWLLGEGEWPLRIPLGAPTEAQARAHWDLFEQWLRQWQGVAGVEFVERRWPGLGVQRLPLHACFESAAAVAACLGEQAGWRLAGERARRLLLRWPALRHALSAQFDVLANTGDEDFDRLLAVLEWLAAHPRSGLYPRQLPIAGVDSKWLESGRQRIVRDWLLALQEDRAHAAHDFIGVAGLRPLPDRIRLRVLDPALRASIGGLGDVVAPIGDIAALRLEGLRRVFVVENLQTGLAFDDLPGSVVVIGRGYAVDVLPRLPWAHGVPLHYWGDIDTHGFGILQRLRRHLPQTRSVLMDRATLEAHRSVWGEEPSPHAAEQLDMLDAAEAALYADLRRGYWRPRVRLEQERIDWSHAWRVLHDAAAD